MPSDSEKLENEIDWKDGFLLATVVAAILFCVVIAVVCLTMANKVGGFVKERRLHGDAGSQGTEKVFLILLRSIAGGCILIGIFLAVVAFSRG